MILLSNGAATIG